jgi:FkbM family methyltransferase
MEDVLLHLRSQAFTPSLVIDAGANKGQWYALAKQVFPGATFHLIEPQPVCLQDLHKIEGVNVHSVALTAPGVKRLRLGGGGAHGGTGCHVMTPGETRQAEDGALTCDSCTLDDLFADRIESDDHILLKLDLKGHEVPTLKGARQLLKSVEVILTEVHVYDPDDQGRSVFADSHAHIIQHGFQLYDVASLSHRPRDGRLRQGDIIYVRQDIPLIKDDAWA